MASSSAQPSLDPNWVAESNLPRILAITGVFNILALISVGLRLYARIGLLRTPGRDDCMMVLAVLGALVGWICFILQGYHGLGRHSVAISKADMQVLSKLGFWQSIVSAIGALGCLKISIAFFLLRLNNSKWYSRTLWGLIGMVALTSLRLSRCSQSLHVVGNLALNLHTGFVAFYTVGAWLTFFFRCKVFSGNWDFRYTDTCYSLKYVMQLGLANAAFNIFTDICFATLPVSIIWSLQMSQCTRISLMVVLSLGYLAVAMGVVKIAYLVTIPKDHDAIFNQYVQFWGFLQLNVGIIAASIPTLKPLLRKATGTSHDSPYDHFNDIERPKTIGTARVSRPRRSFLTAMANRAGRDNFEMTRMQAESAQSCKIEVYTVNDERAGSEDSILGRESPDANRIRCTTEVVVDSVERDPRASVVGAGRN
ncbi:integral membrane [Pyrenophora seminiperda CCB06]|uniref:Integral membrane n=1 Tax=Pyrenophora seminiperda CCB06 TaxID=1302712 RepID=A0A3M7LZW7_9PLEO|nr:integral membrane [Pyrenophora seminiperda CCB06]